MPTDRRVLVLLVVALAAAAPAAALRLLCVGRACRDRDQVRTLVPYCSLPEAARQLLAAGFRDGRGPHILAVAGEMPVAGSDGTRTLAAPWPTDEPDRAGRIPLAFWGSGVAPGTEIPSGTRLDAVAPTVAQLIGLDRPHPGVRSGEAVPGVASDAEPRLVLLVAWKGVGSGDLETRRDAWPNLRGLVRRGAGTLDAEVGSVPLDPAAVLATVGTGGLPKDHGITGALVRNDRGRVVTAWGPGTPFSVIATLGDDLDELTDQAPRIGLVGTQTWDRGLIGGNWYIENDRDDVVLDRRTARQVAAAERLLSSGYGADEVPDLLAVAMDGPVPVMDQALGALVEAAQRATGGRVAVVLTATGSTAAPGALPAEAAEAALEADLGDVVEATAVGGFFLDQETMATSGVTDDRVVSAARRLETPGEDRLLADVFPQIAVTFARYC